MPSTSTSPRAYQGKGVFEVKILYIHWGSRLDSHMSVASSDVLLMLGLITEDLVEILQSRLI